MSKGTITKTAAVVGFASVGVFALLFVALMLTTYWEQAQTPGEKNLGVAALFILFAFPMLVCAAVAVVSFLISASTFFYQRFIRVRAEP